MRLFDEFERTELRPRRAGESEFGYLNLTARPVLVRVRERLEVWFARYPSIEQIELASRFRSSLEQQQQAAFFELMLYELLLQLGCQVTLHPEHPDSEKKPDFEVLDAHTGKFYLEATVVTGQSQQEAGTQARIDTVLDGINQRLASPDYFIGMNMGGTPNTPPPLTHIVSFLKDKLAQLDPEAFTNIDPEIVPDIVPRWSYEHDGWSVAFFPIPKRREARGQTEEQVIGLISTGATFSNHHAPIKKAIVSKASRYGELERPYVVAINSLNYADERDILKALYGVRQPGTPPESSIPVTSDAGWGSAANGAWWGPTGPTNTRISAVLIFYRWHAVSVSQTNACLYHNPWAKLPYCSVLTRLSQAINREGKLTRLDGDTLSTLLGLPKAWPEDYPNQERTEALA